MEINLLPNIVLNRRREARWRQLATVGLVGWVGLWIFLAIVAASYLALKQAQLNGANNTYTTRNNAVNSADNIAFRKEAQEVQTSLAALNQLFGVQYSMSAVNARLAELTPKAARIREIRYEPNQHLNITGVAGSYTEASKMLYALKQSQTVSPTKIYFDNVVFAGANKADNGVAFSITANYHNGDTAGATK